MLLSIFQTFYSDCSLVHRQNLKLEQAGQCSCVIFLSAYSPDSLGNERNGIGVPLN